MLLKLTLALMLSPPGEPADMLLAADRAAQAHEYERAAELCLEVADKDETEDQLRQDALQAALGYADIAVDETGSVESLCRAYASLVEHGQGDVLALKPVIEERLESIEGPSWRASCFAPSDPVEQPRPTAEDVPPPISSEPPSDPPRPALLSVTPTTIADRQSTPRGRGLTIAGATLVSIGAASLAGMTATLIVWDHKYDSIIAHGDAVNQGAEKTPTRNDEVERLGDSDAYLKPLAITTGTLGAATLITGVALLIAGHRKHSRDVNVTPTFSRAFHGLSLTARF